MNSLLLLKYLADYWGGYHKSRFLRGHLSRKNKVSLGAKSNVDAPTTALTLCSANPFDMIYNEKHHRSKATPCYIVVFYSKPISTGLLIFTL
jgi:hypothetical protein